MTAADRPPVSGEPTFNPAVPNDPEPGQVCEECGKPRYQHRDGGAAYGLICPPVSGEPRREAFDLIRDLVQHWDAGDIDHDYDAITGAFDAARDYVRRHGTLAGEHRHPASTGAALDASKVIGLALDYFLPLITRDFAGQDAQDRIDARMTASKVLHAEYARLAEQEGEDR